MKAISLLLNSVGRAKAHHIVNVYLKSALVDRRNKTKLCKKCCISLLLRRERSLRNYEPVIIYCADLFILDISRN